MESSLEQENRLLLDLVQAALGVISRQFNAISFRIYPDRIHLYVAVRERTAEVEEDVEELVLELCALRSNSFPVKASIHVGIPDADWPGISGRRLYVSKEALD